MEVKVNEIYRHISGSLYQVIAVSSPYSCKNMEYTCYVTLKSLGANTFTTIINTEEMFSPVADEVAELVGQKYLFEIVKDFRNDISDYSTPMLVSELKHRKDNPFSEDGDPNIYKIEYEIGYWKPVRFPKEDREKGQMYFEPRVVCSSLDEARSWIKRNLPFSGVDRLQIMKVVRIFEDLN